jgi:omega-6 fatty acid desaturase (delta-12 desaturase)
MAPQKSDEASGVTQNATTRASDVSRVGAKAGLASPDTDASASSSAWFPTSVAAPLNLFGPALTPSVPEIVALDDKRLTVDFLRNSVPKELFQRSALRSLGHVALDLLTIAAFGFAAAHIQLVPSAAARAALWALYWFAQGSVMTGVWVLAHECGHQSFSESKALNDSVGWLLHSALLVPYHSWRISHSNHHANTCSMEHDEVFVPSTRAEFGASAVSESPVVHALDIAKMLLFGWPAYLVANFAGPAKYAGKPNSHFLPGSALFSAENARDVLVSALGFALALGGVALAAREFGAQQVAAYYGVPYLVVNMFLVLITYLQHTDDYVPHYRAGEWTYLRGALSTVDRSFGWLMDHTLHHISDTHVVHHLFSQMPFYHAVEATRHVKRALGKYYLRDDTPIPAALFRSWAAARFVEDEGKVLFMKSIGELNASIKLQNDLVAK